MVYGSSVPDDTDFFQQVENCPEIKEKLRRGIKLDELSKVRQFLEQNQADSYFKKTYGFLVDGINLIRDFHMDQVPAADPSAYLTSVRHWVGLTGYFNVGLDQLAREEMDSKWIINILTVRTRMLIMNTDAYRIFRMLVTLRPRVNRLYHLRVLMIALHMLHESGSPFSVFMTPSFVKYIWYRFGFISEETLTDDSWYAYLLLKESGMLVDEHGLIERLLKESCCIPSGSAYADDGWYHFMTLPSWTLGVSPFTGADYTGNYVTDWGYLVTTE